MSLVLLLLVFASEAFSSILGIDFGTSSYKMVITPEGKRRLMQLLLNDQSSRKTENAIGFRGEERLFGSFAINNMKFSPATSYAYLRDLLGVRSVEVAKERVGRYVSYADHLFETEGDYKLIGIKNPVTGSNFTVLELVGMIFQQAVRIAEADSGSKIHDLCVTVPVYFSDVERQALMDAASIAGLRIIALVDQGTALAVTYGNEQTFNPGYLRNVIFFDFGESSLQLTLAQFSLVTERKKNVPQVEILATAYEHIGGRDFNEALVQHFMQQVKEKSGKPDIDQNARVVSKVRIQMGKTKETLSASKEASFTLQNLEGDFDFSGSITREEFEALSEDLYPRIEAALERLMNGSNVAKDEIYAVELIGGSSRIPRVHSIIRQFFNKEKMDNHMNADEAAVFGSAFYGASHSGRYRAAGVKIRDRKNEVNVTTNATTNSSESNATSIPDSSNETDASTIPPTDGETADSTANPPADPTGNPSADPASQQEPAAQETGNEVPSATNPESEGRGETASDATNSSSTAQPVVPLPEDLKAASKKALARQDRLEKLRVKNGKFKNDIETMIYDWKTRVEEPEIVKHSTAEERDNLMKALREASDWLDDEAPTAGIRESRKKWQSLQALVDPIFARISEEKNMKKMAELAEQLRKKQAAEEAWRKANEARYRNASWRKI